jgi:hypothetical protein
MGQPGLREERLHFLSQYGLKSEDIIHLPLVVCLGYTEHSKLS